MQDYCIVSEYTVKDTVVKVKELLAKGWRVSGGISSSWTTNFIFYSQAMVKDVDNGLHGVYKQPITDDEKKSEELKLIFNHGNLVKG